MWVADKSSRKKNGRRSMIFSPVQMWMFVVLVLMLSGGRAAASESNQKQEEQPSMEILEFLGDWQTREGVWFDPTAREEKQESTQEQSHD